jgi:hypothetical protein
LSIIDDHAKIWERVIGTRGFTGKRVWNSQQQFNNLFDVEEIESESEEELDQNKLDSLEDSV